MIRVIQVLPFIPFGIFFVCCVAQFPVFGRLGAALRQRHPEEWANTKISLLGLPLFGREWALMLSRRHLHLSDPDLTKKVLDARRLTVIGFSSWALLPVSIYIGIVR
jgi:hypothetical protein